MQVRRLDATDPEALDAWHATYHAAQLFGQDYPSPWAVQEVRAQLLGERPGERVEAFSGYVDGRPVVTGFIEMPQMDNRNLAYVEVNTHPEHRRLGHGSRMLEHLTAVALANGRTTLTADGSWPYDRPADGAGEPTAEFLSHHGFTFSLGDVKRALDLPVDDALLDRLAGESAPHHAAYTLRDFRGPVPEDIIDRLGALIGSLVSEAPMGELELEPEVFDRARIRSDEEVFEASGRTKYTTVAVAEDGDVVAYSELVLPAHDPGRVYQWGTLVRPDHRGHRLGMATKVHNLRRFQEQQPGRALLFTFNAEVNSHMIAVNEALGFRPVQRLGEFQKQL
jgi:GNAT superfamily N-acetyltransferase